MQEPEPGASLMAPPVPEGRGKGGPWQMLGDFENEYTTGISKGKLFELCPRKHGK